MESSIGPLLPLFERERAAGRPVALGVLVRTRGSTYRKPGALILIANNGEYAGLISGGCLESDLSERARNVIETGEACVVTYDTRVSEDLLWGLGLGCEGAMEILLLRVGPENGWQPLDHLAKAYDRFAPTAVALITETNGAGLPRGAVFLPSDVSSGAYRGPLVSNELRRALDEACRTGCVSWVEGAALSASDTPDPSVGSSATDIPADAPAWRAFVLPLVLPPRLLILGAGPDAVPVVELSARLGWRVTVADHRPAYAQAARFPTAEDVLLVRPDELGDTLDLSRYSAAVVMSHHLPSDLAYLHALATRPPGYVGLLGPPARRERLLCELGACSESLRHVLRAPVGLPLGGRAPESIALAIVAEIHQYLYARRPHTSPEPV